MPLRPLLLDIPEAAKTYPFSAKFRTVGIDNHMNAVTRIEPLLCGVMRGLDPGLDPRIHLLREKVLTKIDGLPGQARQ